jgi:hypothetical protein
MNALEHWLCTQFRTERAVMAELQQEGIISDDAVWARDVSDGDAENGVKWLKDKATS